MRYKVYAGRVAVDFKNSLGTQTARFHWTEKVLVYDSYGDSIEGEETDGILAEPEVELENKAAGTFSCLVPYQVETRFGTIKNPYYSNFLLGQTWVMVEEDEECIFFGRVTGIEKQFELDLEVTADGILDELSRMQTKLDAGSYQTTSSSGSILELMMHPNQSDKGYSPVNCMERGHVTVDSKSISTEESGTQVGSYWSILTTYLLEHKKGRDGYLRLRLANDPGTEDYFFYYDYLKEEDVPRTEQTIEYGVNMLDMSFEEKRTSELVNSVTAHGIQKVKKGWWIFSKTTYESISKSAKNDFSILAYGLNSRHIYVDGQASTEDSLYKAALEELDNYKQVVEPALTIKAFDRRDAGENVD